VKNDGLHGVKRSANNGGHQESDMNGTINRRRYRPGRRVVAALGMSIAVAALATPAEAAGADTYHYGFKGQTAEARFVSTAGCVVTEAFVHAVDGRLRLGPGRPEAESGVFLAITRFDMCTQQPISFALGFREDLGESLQIDRLDGASLDTTVDVMDMMTNTTVPVTVQVQWSGTLETFKAREHIKLDYPGYKVNSRQSGTSRSAVVSGVISDGTTNYADAPWASGTLSSIHDGTLAVSHL
jgi:hypothetical protein